MTITKTFSNCLFEVHRYEPEDFRMENDGRKWLQKARARRQLLAELASFADADGTNSFPGVKKLMRRLGWGRSTMFRYLDDLEVLGCMKPAGRTGQRGTMKRELFPLTTTKAVPESDSQGPRLDESEGPQGPTFDIRGPGLTPQSPRLESHSPTMMGHNLPVSDLPKKPALPTVPHQKRTVGRMAQSWAGKFGSHLNRQCKHEEWAQLAGQDVESVVRVWNKWIAVRKLDGLRCPIPKFLEEFEETLAIVEKESADAEIAEASKSLQDESEDSRHKHREWRIGLDAAEDIDEYVAAHPYIREFVVDGGKRIYISDERDVLVDDARRALERRRLTAQAELEKERGSYAL